MTSAQQLTQSLDILTIEIQRKVEEWEKENEVALSSIRLERINIGSHSSHPSKSLPSVVCSIEVERRYR